MLVSIPALNDNYIWIYGRENLPVIVIDITETDNLLRFLAENHLQPEVVLLTHYHDDHTAGVAEFKKYYPNIPIFGSVETANKGATHIIDEGEVFTTHYKIKVLPTGGHTQQHISFLVDQHLFCGDCLFSAGCGRVFTGNYEQMYHSLQRLNLLPDDTIVCPAHEYTLANLAFAKTVLKDKAVIQNYIEKVQSLRAKNHPSLPTSLGIEKVINPFLQSKTLEEFIGLRKAKDIF